MYSKIALLMTVFVDHGRYQSALQQLSRLTGVAEANARRTNAAPFHCGGHSHQVFIADIDSVRGFQKVNEFVLQFRAILPAERAGCFMQAFSAAKLGLQTGVTSGQLKLLLVSWK